MTTTVCPIADPASVLQTGDRLFFPMHRSAIVQYGANADGVRELYLFYGDKEISFDEPELFSFGESLAMQASFVAGDAAAWGPGLGWPRIRELLQQLVDEGVLHLAATEDSTSTSPRELEFASPLKPTGCTRARSWDESESILQELAGRALEPGHLELVIPVFRMAHMYVDAEGRQVGEANVFPPALRLESPTVWRACRYSGSRYQNEKPMNITALRSMRAQWPQMMALLAEIRAAYLRRMPDATAGWTVGHIERLTVAVLALTTWQLLKPQGRVQNGTLHPALASLFRVTDGLRMVMHQMLFVPVAEPVLAPDEFITSEAIYDYAERNYSFHSPHAVCAGPQAMIREFMGVLIDGQAPREPAPLEVALRPVLDDIDAAFDYGMMGLRVHAALFCIWPAMTRCYESLADIASQWAATGNERVLAFRDRYAAHLARLRSATLHGSEAARFDREKAYADMFGRSGNALGIGAGEPALSDLIAPQGWAASETLAPRILAALRAHFGELSATDEPHLARMTETIFDYLLRQQSVLRVACREQTRLNALLRRPQPRRAFTAADIDIHNLVQQSRHRNLPFFNDELREYFGLPVVVSAMAIEIAAEFG